jgi:N-acetylmuramoyl-L-alanine amidase
MPDRLYIMVHHSLTEDGQTVSWGAIEKYHRETMLWKDCGYHAGVELIGDSYYALIGRAEDQEAAACPQGFMNRTALHVCCVGNYDLAPPPEGMLAVLVHRIMVPWMRRYSIPPEHIVGHHDYAPWKSCPGTQFPLDRVRALCVAQLGAV